MVLSAILFVRAREVRLDLRYYSVSCVITMCRCEPYQAIKQPHDCNGDDEASPPLAVAFNMKAPSRYSYLEYSDAY